MSGVYVLLSGDLRHPIQGQQNNKLDKRALEVNEVGLEISQSEMKWKLVFPLKKFRDPKCNVHTKDCNAELFGKLISNNPETLTKLGATSKAEKKNIIFTLESL